MTDSDEKLRAALERARNKARGQRQQVRQLQAALQRTREETRKLNERHAQDKDCFSNWTRSNYLSLLQKQAASEGKYDLCVELDRLHKAALHRMPWMREKADG